MISEDRKQQLNAVMVEMYPTWRYRWCEGGLCGCLGCANASGGLLMAGFTKQEWQQWVAENPEPNKNETKTDIVYWGGRPD